MRGLGLRVNWAGVGAVHGGTVGSLLWGGWRVVGEDVVFGFGFECVLLFLGPGLWLLVCRVRGLRRYGFCF
jgi:hypothetical protein